MTNRLPSLAALLGLVAVAGYQNRDQIGAFIKDLKNRHGGTPMVGESPSPDRPEQFTDMLGSGYDGGSLLGGLRDLVEQFTSAGQGRKANSWVSTGPNEPIGKSELEQALGPDLMEQLAKQTGFSREELLERLSRTLPDAVDQMTPEGQISPLRA